MHDVPLVGGQVAVRGATELEPTQYGLRIHRLPADARAKTPDDFIRMCELQPAGVRLAFRTAATRVELDVRALRTVSVNRPPDGSDGPQPDAGRYDIVVDGVVVGSATANAYGIVRLDYATRRAQVDEAPVATVVLTGLPGRAANVEVWLPYGEVITLVAVRADAPVAPSTTAFGPRWVHHGSSISHGANADGPTGTWPVVAARLAGLDLVNLGFSGNAVLDPFTAQAIRDQAAELITLKIGINVVNHDCMRLRAFRPAVEGFLDVVRDGHPSTPLVVISPILCPMVEDCPGPTEIDPSSPDDAIVFRTTGRPEELANDKLSLRVIRRVLREVVDRRRSAGDSGLTYLDGLELYGEAEWESVPMPDLLHPDDAGHRHIGERFAALLPGVSAAAGPTSESGSPAA
jgi:hypothetical protein